MGHRRSPDADSDLDNIWYYIASKSGSLEIADNFVDSLTDRFMLLAEHPNLGRARDEDLYVGVRSFPVGEYVILYRIENGDVVVLRVLRGSRDITRIFEQ